MNTHYIISVVAKYVLQSKKMTSRAVARSLGIHHSTWQRYVKGQSRPTKAIKYKIIRFMRTQSFGDLVSDAFAEKRKRWRHTEYSVHNEQ